MVISKLISATGVAVPIRDPTLIAFFSCAGSQNVNKYCTKDLDVILTWARGEADEAKRKALYAKATDIYPSRRYRRFPL